MKFAVLVTDAALLDLAEAAGWYEQQQAGLGDAFRQDFEAVAGELADGALQHGLRFLDVRRAGLQRFRSYGLFYVIRDSEVLIFAALHGARHPAWVKRRRNLTE